MYQKCGLRVNPCVHVKACPHWIQIQVTELPNVNSMWIQCALITYTLHCAEPNSRVHVDFKWPHLHATTMAASSDLYFSQPSYCFPSWADMWNTVCSLEKHAHCWYSTHERACHALFGPHAQCAIVQSRSIRIETTSGSGLVLIRIGWMRIQCGRAQTGFDLVQCASGVQCGQAFSNIDFLMTSKQNKPI